MISVKNSKRNRLEFRNAGRYNRRAAQTYLLKYPGISTELKRDSSAISHNLVIWERALLLEMEENRDFKSKQFSSSKKYHNSC